MAMPGDFLSLAPLANNIEVASVRKWRTPRMVIASETLVTLRAAIEAEFTSRSSFCVSAKSRMILSDKA